VIRVVLGDEVLALEVRYGVIKRHEKDRPSAAPWSTVPTILMGNEKSLSIFMAGLP
jgi:hypothetical protein